MKRRTLLFVPIMFLALSIVLPVYAAPTWIHRVGALNFVAVQERTVGVSIGDSFKYGVTFNLSSNDPNATIPPYLELINETESISVLVTDVLNTNVTAEQSIHYKNGTDKVELGITDVDGGNGNMSLWIVGANLNAADPVYTAGYYSTWKINETIIRDYLGVPRDTNHVNMTQEMNMSGIYQYSSMDYYWDRLTGVQVETSFIMKFQNATTQTNMTGSVAIAGSNVWLPSSIAYFEIHNKLIASFMLNGVEHWFWIATVTASPYGTGNMAIIYKNVSVAQHNFSVYVAPEDLLLGEKYGWLTSLTGNGIIVPEIYTFEGAQSASVNIEETETYTTATVSGSISLNITYTPYGDSSIYIEDPGDRPYVNDHDEDGFWSYSIRRTCTVNGSFNDYQLGPTNFDWGYFDITDYEWYDLATFDSSPPDIGVPSQNPPRDDVQPYQNVTVSVNITDTESGVKNAMLYYSLTNGTTWEAPVPMSFNATTSLYEAIILGQPADSLVRFRIVAYDTASNNVTRDGKDPYFTYQVVPEFPSVIIVQLFMALSLISAVFMKLKKKRIK